jgi:hypothetical protein
MTLHAWAKKFNVSGTWVEQWAQDTLDFWHKASLSRELRGKVPEGESEGPLICTGSPIVRQSSGVEMSYPSPSLDGRTAADVFSCNLTGTPFARLSHGITIGGDASVLWSPGEDDETAFRRHMRATLEAALDEFFKHAVECGASGQISIPKDPEDLDLKIECAALYVLCNVSRPRLAELTHRVGKEAMYLWLKDTVEELLDLRMPPRGHRSSVY